MLRSFQLGMKELLGRPVLVFWGIALLIFFQMVGDGTFLKMWNLYQSHKVLDIQIAEIKEKNVVLEQRIEQWASAKHLETQAKDRLNLVAKEDLIFIFSDEQSDLK